MGVSGVMQDVAGSMRLPPCDLKLIHSASVPPDCSSRFPAFAKRNRLSPVLNKFSYSVFSLVMQIQEKRPKHVFCSSLFYYQLKSIRHVHPCWAELSGFMVKRRSKPRNDKAPAQETVKRNNMFVQETKFVFIIIFWPTEKIFPSFGCRRFGIRMGNHRFRNFEVRASGTSGSDLPRVAPLQLESPSGQLLSQIIQTHPHLLCAAIDQQLELLKTERDAQNNEKMPDSQDLLKRRITEVKEKERQKTLEEIIYCVVVQKFIDNDITMVPTVSLSADPTVKIDSWPNQEQKLESVHSPDALEMIHSHLSLILGERVIEPLNSIVQISKVKLGKLYAASIMYGYFLKRVDQRFQLERSMNTLPKRVKDNETILGNLKPNPFWDMESLVQVSTDEDGFEVQEAVKLDEEAKLRSYVMCLDAETLQMYATMRSKEAMSLIEKQTQALFGRPDIRITDDGSIDISNDEVVSITFRGMTMLVLEAVAFGSFLWDAESYVEPRYNFLKS